MKEEGKERKGRKAIKRRHNRRERGRDRGREEGERGRKGGGKAGGGKREKREGGKGEIVLLMSNQILI